MLSASFFSLLVGIVAVTAAAAAPVLYSSGWEST
jgi:hypothetical protein